MSTTESLDSGQTIQRPQATPPSAAELPHGDARYEPIGVLGEGGMGRVLEAVDKQFSRVVALKELRGSGGNAARLHAEAMVTGNLEHPGIPPVYERGLKSDGTPWYAMRRVRGRSLELAMREAQGLPERLALLPAVTRAAQTLGFAHEKGVVHRDIKPDNIMVGTHGEVFVVDWGLARAGQLSESGSGSSTSSSGGGSTRTVTGAVMGTPAYMAPEQARGDGHLVDARTDVFALGAVLYRLLSGKPPFEADSTAEAIERAARADCPPLEQVARDAPAPLRDICTTAMAPHPAQRFPTAQHLADALEHFSSSAVSRAYEQTASRTSQLALGFGLLTTFIGLSGITRLANTSLLFGPHLFIGLTFFAVSMWLAWLETRSGGRLGLTPMGYGMALCIVLTGFIAVGFAVLTKPDPLLAARQAGVALAVDSLLTATALGVWGIAMFKRSR